MGGKKAFELMLEIGHKSQPLKSKLPNGYTHKWTVFVRGANNSKIEHCIQRVVFQLHDSFANPHRGKLVIRHYNRYMPLLCLPRLVYTQRH